MAQNYKISETILCCAVSNDKMAVGVGSSVLVYSLKAGVWKNTHSLDQHDKLVTGVDFSSNGRIVSCSQDRNAYVWTLIDDIYVPTLVNLRINRAATFVKWSPDGSKFAVGSGARIVCICWFEVDNDWWVSSML